MRGVSAFADRAQSVESRHAEGGGKVTVGGAAGAAFFQHPGAPAHAIHAGGDIPRLGEKSHDATTALHGRTVDAAHDLEAAARIEWAKFRQF